MPTQRRRHILTETDPVARALDDAAARWPDEQGNRARLLLRLVDLGHRALLRSDEERLRRRQHAIERTAGALSGLYGPGYLDDLRDDWPR